MMVGLFAFVVTGYISYDYAMDVITTNTHNQLENESKTHGVALRTLLESRLIQNNALGNDSVIQQLIEEINMKSASNADIKHAEEYHNKFLKQIQIFEEKSGYSMSISDVTILDNEGKVMFMFHMTSDTIEMDRAYLDIAINEPKSFAIFEQNEGMPILAVVSPIFADSTGQQIGVIITRTTSLLINNMLFTSTSLGDDVEMYMVDRTKEMVALHHGSHEYQEGQSFMVDHNNEMIDESKFITKDTGLQTIIDNEAVNTCLEDNSGYSGTYVNYRQTEVYGATYCAQDLGLVLLAEVDKSIVEAPLGKLQDNIIQVGAVIMAGMSGLAILVARTISKPICKLKTVAGEIANGNFDVKSDIHGKDEIGDLAGEFDIMAHKLKESMNRLREKESVIRQQEGVLLQFSSRSEKYCVGMIDIINSTKTCTKMNDTQMSEFYKIFINSMGLIIQKYEGTVVKNIGDALLFYFSIYGHDEKRILKKCLSCCINMCEIHDIVSRRLKRAGLPQMSYRISTTYGIVRIAKSSTSLVEDIFGTTVNRCSKINRSAPSNGVIIDEYFYEIVKDFEEYEFEKKEEDLILHDHGYSGYVIRKKMLAELPHVAQKTKKLSQGSDNGNNSQNDVIENNSSSN